MEGTSGTFDLPLTLFGGRFGKTGTEHPDEILMMMEFLHILKVDLH